MELVISNRKNVLNAEYFASPADLESYLATSSIYYDVLLFVFWSWIVPKEMLDKHKVYGMHTGPLLEGKGRGGSPIDNLKALGVKWTTLCVFEMNEKIDGGRVVLAIPFNIEAEKADLIENIDESLPDIVAYITAKQPEIPAVFKRIANV